MENKVAGIGHFSLFRPCITNGTPFKDGTLQEVVYYIKGDYARERTKYLRSIDDKKKADEFMENNFFSATFGGVFSSRDNDHLVSASNLLCLDFNDVPDIKACHDVIQRTQGIGVALLFTSPSNNGLRCVVRIRTDAYTFEQVFAALSNYFGHTYGLTPDPRCMDISKPSYLPHDDKVYINYDPALPDNEFYQKWLIGPGLPMASLASFPSLASPSIDPGPYHSSSGKSNEEGEAYDGSDANQGSTMPTFSQDVKDKLPPLLKSIIKCSISDADADILILGVITTISAFLPNIYGVYLKRVVYPNLYLFVTAPAGTGKGRLGLCKQLVVPIHKEIHSQEESVSPILPANSSSTSFYQGLNENGGWALVFETEGDTFTVTLEQDYGNYSDGVRKAFHHETIAYKRRTKNEHVEIEEPRLSIVLSGTHRQELSLMKNAENGLLSRFIIYYLNGKIKWDDVLDEGNGETLDWYFRIRGEAFRYFYHALKKLPRIKFKFTKEQGAIFNTHFSRLQADYLELFGEKTVASVRRLGLITFRIAMVLSSMRIFLDNLVGDILECREDDFETAMIISQVLQQHMLRAITELPSSSSSKDISKKAKESLLLHALWDALPDRFETRQFLDIAVRIGLSEATAERYLRQWLETRLDKELRGRYKKK